MTDMLKPYDPWETWHGSTEKNQASSMQRSEGIMKMKKVEMLLLIVLLTYLVCMPRNAAAEGATQDNLLARIFVKNSQSEILRNHRSFTCTDVDEADGSTYYIDADVSVKDCVESHDYVRVRTSEFDYCRFTSGVLGRWVHFESDSCSWAGLSEDMLSEKVLSVEEQDGMLTVTTRPSEEVRKNILEDEYAGMENRDKIQFRNVYVLDADTLELMSITDYDTLPDGSEVKAYELLFAYDVDLPYAEEIAAIQAHLDAASNYRSTTFVLDEGTAYEIRYTYMTPMGDGCFMPEEITKDGILYRIDAERSILTNEAKDNDAILYLDRVDAQSAE